MSGPAWGGGPGRSIYSLRVAFPKDETIRVAVYTKCGTPFTKEEPWALRGKFWMTFVRKLRRMTPLSRRRASDATLSALLQRVSVGPGTHSGPAPLRMAPQTVPFTSATRVWMPMQGSSWIDGRIPRSDRILRCRMGPPRSSRRCGTTFGRNCVRTTRR
jgi:hypothetical protein